MAYKFQLGAAVLSGSLTQEGQILAKDSKVSGSSIGITDASGLAETGGGLADSGDGTLELSMDGMMGTDFTMNQDKIFFAAVGGAGGNIRSGSISDLVSGMTGSALAASNGVLSVSNLANAQIASNAAIGLTKLAAVAGGSFILGNAANQATVQSLSGDVAAVSNGGAVTLTSAQTSISSLKHNSLVVGRVSGNDDINFADGSITIDTNNISRVTVTDTAVTIQPNVTIQGNLTVNGTTTTVESSTLMVKDKTIELNVVTGSEGRASNSGAGFFFSGSTEPNDASLLLTADGGRFKASGSSAGFDVQTGGDYRINGVSILSATALASTVLVDGDSLRINNCASSLNSDTLEAADLFVVDDGAAGAPKKITAGNLRTFFQQGVTADSAGGFSYNAYNINTATATNADGSTGFYAPSGSTASNPVSASHATALHLSGGASGWSNGMVLYIKAPSNASDFNLTVHASGSEKIDGSSTVLLESDNAAITLLRCHDGRWSIV